MIKFWFFAGCVIGLSVTGAAQQQIKVHPTSVNVYSQGATTFFLTFGGLGNYRPAEANWCADVVLATPDLGLKCAPGTIYGTLPTRYDQSRRSGNQGYTDIVSVPPSVARRAYLAAAAGESAPFFYVRRFVSATGSPDQYLAVTLRLSGNGARVPFSLTDVRLGVGTASGPTRGDNQPLLLFIKSGQKLPPVKAEISYTGTGRLKGRWEIVQPGEALPEARDLLTEATLPAEERGLQKRFTEVQRFNVFLPPVGRYTLAGPDPARLPNKAAGQYLILLRIEAVDDREGDSDLAAVGAGAGIVHSGGAAGFPLPFLRYVVGGSDNTRDLVVPGQLSLLLPTDNLTLSAQRPVDFAWTADARAAFYELEVQDANGKRVLSAVLRAGVTNYRAPSWLKDKALNLRWRVTAKDGAGKPVSETDWQRLRLVKGR